MNGNIESGMEFAEQPENYFKVESCPTMRALNVKTCDFIIAKKSGVQTRIFLIEAKSSAPKPLQDNTTQKEPWEKFLQNICEKMVTTLLVFIGLKVGRHYSQLSDLPDTIARAVLGDLSITPCLVLKEHPPYALFQISDALKIRLQPIVKSFVLDQPIVINADMAIKKGLVTKIIS